MGKKLKRLLLGFSFLALFLLAASVYSTYDQLVKKSQSLDCSRNLLILSQAIYAYREETGMFPQPDQPLYVSLRDLVDDPQVFHCPSGQDMDSSFYGRNYRLVDNQNDVSPFVISCPNHSYSRTWSSVLRLASIVPDGLSNVFFSPAFASEEEPGPNAFSAINIWGLSRSADGVTQVPLTTWHGETRIVKSPDSFMAKDDLPPIPDGLDPVTCLVGTRDVLFGIAMVENSRERSMWDITLYRGRLRIVPLTSTQPVNLRAGQSAVVIFLDPTNNSSN